MEVIEGITQIVFSRNRKNYFLLQIL